MSNQYEVEHNISADSAPRRQTRRVDMSTFLSFLSQITPDDDTPQQPAPTPHTNVFSTPTPNDASALFGLVRDQLATLAVTAPTTENANLLSALVESLSEDVAAPPGVIPGVSAEFVDSLDRVPRKQLDSLAASNDGTCPICAESFLNDPHPLVVRLPCHKSHVFDLECVQPWLRSKGSCPMCRVDFTPKPKVVDEAAEEEEREAMDADMYG